MSTLFVCNHSYHLQSIRRNLTASDSVIIIGKAKSCKIEDSIRCRVLINMPLFESLKLRDKIVWRSKLKKYISSLLKHNTFNKVIFFGVQDYFSYRLYQFYKSEVKCVALDNLESLLRPEVLSFFIRNRNPSWRLVVKLILYGVVIDFICSRVGEFGGRFVYSANGAQLEESLSFYRLDSGDKSNKLDSGLYISQPYYLDYNVDLSSWVERLDEVLSPLGVTKVRFHQRDSLEYRSLLLSLGYEESHKEHEFCYGLFSTLLFQEAVSGKRVYSLISYFYHLLPTHYVQFVLFISQEISLSLDGSMRWKLNSSSFDKLIEYIGISKFKD